MSKSLYIAAASARAGKGLAALGVMDVLARKVGRIGLFRPITPGYEERDALIEMLIAQYNLDIKYEDVCPFEYDDIAESLAQGNTEKVISQVVDAYNKIKNKYDFTLIIGSDFLGPTAASELELNAMFATNLGSPVLLIVSGNDLSAEEVATSAGHARHVLSENGCSIVSTIINRVPNENRDSVLTTLAKHAEINEPVYVLREVPVLSALTIDEIAAGLGGELVSGEGPDLQREVDRYVAGSGHVPMILGLLDAGVLLVAAGDRDDLAVAAAAVASSPELPSPAGLVLTCGVIPDNVTMRLLKSSHLPVIAVKEDTYQTLHKLDQIPGQIRVGSRRKIAAALAEFSAGVAIDELEKNIQLSETVVITPLMFTVNILEKARSEKKHIVLPEGDDERILRAADELLHGEIVNLTILGKVEEIKTLARHLGLDISAAQIVDPEDSPLRKEFADEYAKLRAHKGIGWQDAFDRMSDPSYFGTMLVYKGYADGMVSGATHTTAETIRPALEVIKTVPGVSLVSSTFLMCMPDKVLAFADCAVNPDPNSEQLAEIALSTAATAQAFGITPRIAMLSYSTGDSGTGADVEKVRKATEILQAARPDLPIAGPIQYDAAVDAGVAEAKMPGNAVAGKATVLIFPDLNSGNTAYKAVQRSANAIAVGPVLQGLKKPVNDLSRGCTIPDIVSTVAITAIQAQSQSKGAKA
ncbi:MAG: phosphate acetyltransferase [Actinomycetota bacterium]